MIAPTEVAAAFREAWGRPPDLVAFAPGRVNLIGEHIDYHGGPVLPAALGRGISVAAAGRSGLRVRARSVDASGRPSRHGEVAFEAEAGLAPDPAGGWGNYLRAAARVAVAGGVDTGADLLVVSDLPEASGLSSSSALVVAVGLALLSLGGGVGLLDDARRRQLAEDFAAAERFTGTRGGGMDQAASLGGVAGHALRLTFDPLRWARIPVPPQVALVVADSGVRAEKAGAAQEAYNRLRAGSGEPRIAAHIDEERARVDAAVAALAALASGGAEAGPHLDRLGGLVNASHASLRDRLHVSHPALEALVAAAVRAGAVGARLTGAGFGGSIVAVAHRDRADDVVRGLRAAQAALPGAPVPAFVARISGGARVVSPAAPRT